MAFALDPALAVDSAVEHWPIALVIVAALWVALRELGPIRRLRRLLS
ncbi:hypothetical protein [Halorhabdus amylolytica]|nr:hypothetical protein [Halorhabdus amylolytica]